ncbi:hypothetical protein B0G77_7636 [Paraburkholderia sp. BL10I2N1]|nr:hypothetical protein B0G77_7636 [Paraburkholderia sp. BL10I2N1]
MEHEGTTCPDRQFRSVGYKRPDHGDQPPFQREVMNVRNGRL